MIFNEICNNIIEIGMLEFQNEMASFSDYSLYTSYLTEATASNYNKKKNILSRAFDTIIRMFNKLAEKIQSFFNGGKSKDVDDAINNLKKTSDGKAMLSKKREFKVFKNTKKLDSETAKRLMKAKSLDEIERIMSSYRKQRNSTIKVVSIAIGSVAAISAMKYVLLLKDEIRKAIDNAETYKKLFNDSAVVEVDLEEKNYNLRRYGEYMLNKSEDRHKKATEHIKNMKKTLDIRNKEVESLYIKLDELSKKKAEAFSEVSKNQAHTITEEAKQQINIYNYIMKVSNADINNKDYRNVFTNIGDIQNMSLKEATATMNKLKKLRSNLQGNTDKMVEHAQLNAMLLSIENHIRKLQKK